ncbi:hypothetical protein EYF80_019465 [Liparis tanakae]|uniref:Uncharacterized protein n=1 Tax=Liparis tanakae TaxID=230148 RepID=A0A4Z2HXF3_9TELE|nr:hypothetical protein EYF80_019465 [Liparis tanakae]
MPSFIKSAFTQSVNQRAVPHRGPRSGCRPLKLTAGICRLEGRMWSLAALKDLCGSSGERRGERRGERSPPRPSLPRGGIAGRGECSPSDPDPSSTSLMDGSFLTIPPLLSQCTKKDKKATCLERSERLTPSSYLGVVSLPEVVRQVVLDLSDELLGVVGVEAEHLAEAFEADVLEVAYLHGAGAHEVDGLEGVALAYEELPRCTKGGLDDEGERAQTPPAGRLKQRQLQQLVVQVHGDVGPQLIREVLQEL